MNANLFSNLISFQFLQSIFVFGRFSYNSTLTIINSNNFNNPLLIVKLPAIDISNAQNWRSTARDFRLTAYN